MLNSGRIIRPFAGGSRFTHFAADWKQLCAVISSRFVGLTVLDKHVEFNDTRLSRSSEIQINAGLKLPVTSRMSLQNLVNLR